MPQMPIMTWNVSPELLQIGPLTFRWYGVLFATGFAVGFELVKKMFEREKRPVIYVDYLVFTMMLATVIGARLGHTLFYEPSIYLADPIRILYIWEGGLASHGAALGIFLGLFLFTRKYREFTFLYLVDRLSVVVALAGFFIRLGNFFNSEIIGKPTESHFGIIFSRVDLVPRHPTQLYEALCYLIIFFGLHRLYWKTRWAQFPGFIFGQFLVWVFGVRFFVEFLKENQVAFESQLPINLGQIFSIPLILLGLTFVIRGIQQERSLASSPKPSAKKKTSR
jgi:phosphatidylglycerol---prolipoprotein diacylglyceryl transferase